jgi:hypothetical protein
MKIYHTEIKVKFLMQGQDVENIKKNVDSYLSFEFKKGGVSSFVLLLFNSKIVI